MPGFADHFSGNAAGYAAARPTYPDALFEWLASVAPAIHPRLAWDCGTGSGQAAVALGQHFDAVIATDASAAQLRHAALHPRIAYAAATAEAAPIAHGTIALVTVAQALHWFDLERFYAEVRRTAAPGAVIAAWTYAHAVIDPQVDAVLRAFDSGDLAGCWPPERQHVDDGYGSLAFPFSTLEPPSLEMSATWTREELVAYVGTWSAVAALRRRSGRDPIPALEHALRAAWPDGVRRVVRWPLVIRAGRVPASSAGTQPAGERR